MFAISVVRPLEGRIRSSNTNVVSTKSTTRDQTRPPAFDFSEKLDPDEGTNTKNLYIPIVEYDIVFIESKTGGACNNAFPK